MGKIERKDVRQIIILLGVDNMREIRVKKYQIKLLFFLFIIILISFLGVIEVRAVDYINYEVKSGDYLCKIAAKFSTTENEIINLNGIKNPDLIFKGQIIRVKKNSNSYIVESGDTLVSIANKHNSSVEKIIRANNISNPDYIVSGQKIDIPLTANSLVKSYRVMSRYKNNNFIWPCQGKISSPYGWRTHPIYKKELFHTGIDIALTMGSPVYAVMDGIVSYSDWETGYGRLIKLKHRDGEMTYYGHNLKLLVSKGEKIKQGKIIALSGNSGLSTGPHLHFEIRVNNKHVDPMKYLNKSYSRENFQI